MTKHVLQSVLDAKMVNYIVINRPYYIKLTVQQRILQHITAQAKLDAFAKNALHLITAFHKSKHDYVSNLRSNLVPDTYIRKKCIQRIFDQISQKVLYIWCKFRNIHQIIILLKLYDSGFGILQSIACLTKCSLNSKSNFTRISNRRKRTLKVGAKMTYLM